jgi:hypothetical protein
MAGPWEKYGADAKPWEKYAPAAEERLETEEEVNARVKAKYGNMSFWDRTKADFRFMKENAFNPLARGVIKGVNAIPALAADLGVGVRNLFPGQDYELPSTMYERDFYDKVFPMGEAPNGKTLEFGASLLSGAKVPAPQVKNPAPAGFVRPSPNQVKLDTLAASKGAGYVVPPSTPNPTAANKFLESFGGKIATAQDAALRNQEVTNTLAKRALGLSEDAPLAQESLSALRKEAGKAYEVVRGVGNVALDDATSKSLDGIAAKFTGSKLKDALGGGTDIPKVVQAIKDEPLTGDTAVDVIALLRDKADAAYRAGASQQGKAYKEISKTIENLMEKSLSGEALKNFRDARQLIAMSRSVEGAFNPSSGNVVATKLAAQLGKGKPLSGDLRTIGQFGQAFPKAAQDIVDSGSVRNTDAILGSGASVFTGNPWYLGWPFLRQGARSFLLSEAGQGMAAPSAANGIPPEVAMGLISGANSLR